MPRQIIIAEQHRIAAVFSEEQIQELIVASGEHQVGDVYVGVVENVLPSIDAAFVNIGNPDRNGFIHVSDLGPLRLKRSSSSITELVTPQQRVLVQVMKEPTGNKGPRLTGELSFPGRYLVLMPFGRGVKLSRRILDDDERNRLKSLAILIKPSQMGLLVRTEAENVPDEAVIEDLEYLKKLWEDIQYQHQVARGPGLLSRDEDFVQRVLRDSYSADVNRIVTDSPAALKRVKQFLQSWNQGQMPSGLLVDAHRDPPAILEFFRVNAAIRQALRPRVDLPSGGYIIIEPTEALTVIDVNSGSFTQSATARETVLWTNCEAATEIARQLRLRNIAGVIIVDFIDMDARQDQQQVLEHFNKALRHDKARPQIAQLSELGLVELTRKRQGQSVYELFGTTCTTCDGLGQLVKLPGSASSTPQSILDPNRPPMVDLSPVSSSGGDLAPEPAYDPRNGARAPVKSKHLRPITPRRTRPGARREESLGDFLTAERLDLTEPATPGSDFRDKGSGGAFRSSKGFRGEAQESALPPTRLRESSRRVVSVEMTPLQQKIYSEMGLSPSLLLPSSSMPLGRDVVLQVVLPGTLPDQNLEKAPPLESQDPLLETKDLEDMPPFIAPDVFPGPDSADLSPSLVEPDSYFPEEILSPPFESESVAPEKQSPAASRRKRSQPRE
jgi:ribonuclease E